MEDVNNETVKTPATPTTNNETVNEEQVNSSQLVDLTINGNDGNRSALDPTNENNPDSNAAIPTREEINELLFEYKKCNTKITKTVHHQEFLEECQEKQIMMKGLQLKLTLNVMDQDRALEVRIQGILIKAELEILEEIINHYEELGRKVSGKLLELKTTVLCAEKISPNV